MNIIQKMFNRKIYQFLLIIMMGISIIPLVLSGLVIYDNTNSSFFNQSITASEQQSEAWGFSINSIFDHGVKDMQSIGKVPAIYDATQMGISLNKTSLYATYEGTKFGSANSSENLPKKDALSWNPNNDVAPEASKFLDQFVKDNPEFVEIFVTDTRGYVVATMSSIPGDFDQNGEEWFEVTESNGLFTEYEFDESSGFTVYTISILLENNGAPYGILKSALYFNALLTDFEDFKFYETGFGFLGEKNSDTIVSIGESNFVGQNISKYMSIQDIKRFSTNEDRNGGFFSSFNSKSYFIGYYTKADSPFYTIVLIPTTSYDAAVNSLFITMFVITSLAILLAFIISNVVANTISKPLAKISEVSQYAANGNLSHDQEINADPNSNNEIYVLSANFKTMLVSIKDIVSNVSSTASVLASSSQDFASSAEEVNAASEEITSIVSQMSSGSQTQVIQINNSVNYVNELKKQFEEKIEDINQTSSLIETISSQVNMLALNASIEAARAGEYGRGFAVVADNIRALADDTKNSVLKVNTTIENLRNAITESIDKITKSISTVAAVSEETAAGSEEVSSATEEQSATMQEITASAQELTTLATNLEQMVSKFKL